MQDIIFIAIGIVIVLLFMFSVSVIHIRGLRDDLNNRWYNIVDKLQYRQDLLPMLIETVRKRTNTMDRDLELMIDTRARAGKNTKSGMLKMVVEHDLSNKLKEIMQKAKLIEELRIDSDYMWVKKELKDMNVEIEKISKIYNQRVRKHNKIVQRVYNIVPTLVLRYGPKQIFDFE